MSFKFRYILSEKTNVSVITCGVRLHMHRNSLLIVDLRSIHAIESILFEVQTVFPFSGDGLLRRLRRWSA